MKDSINGYKIEPQVTSPEPSPNVSADNALHVFAAYCQARSESPQSANPLRNSAKFGLLLYLVNAADSKLRMLALFKISPANATVQFSQ